MSHSIYYKIYIIKTVKFYKFTSKGFWKIHVDSTYRINEIINLHLIIRVWLTSTIINADKYSNFMINADKYADSMINADKNEYFIFNIENF